MRTLRRRDARGEQGHRKLVRWQPEPTLHSAGSRFKPRSLVSSAIRRLPAAEACRRGLKKAVSTLSYPSSPQPQKWGEKLGVVKRSAAGDQYSKQLGDTIPGRKVAEDWRPPQSGQTTAQAAGGRRGRYPIAISFNHSIISGSRAQRATDEGAALGAAHERHSPIC